MTDNLSLAAASPASILPPTLTIRRKRPEDTADGCRAFAAADLRRAEDLAVEHVRWRYRHSAEAWFARADLLDQLEAKFQERLAGRPR
jgi:hypothetical protein